MDQIRQMVNEIEQFVIKMRDVLAEGTEGHDDYIVRADCLASVTEGLGKIVPHDIYADHKDVLAFGRDFCLNCKNEGFMQENKDRLLEVLSEMRESLAALSEACSDKERYCSCCEERVVYKPQGGKLVCPRCGANGDDRLIVSYLKKINLEKAKEKTPVLQIMPSIPVHEWIQDNCTQVSYDSNDPTAPGATFHSEVEDLAEIDDNLYDLIVYPFYLQQAGNQRKALQALKRVLRDEGQIVLAKPLEVTNLQSTEDENSRDLSRNGYIETLEEEFFVHSFGKEYFGRELFNECMLGKENAIYVLTKKEDVALDMEYVLEIDEDLCQNGPLVSVVMSAYNHEPFVAAAIESVINQSYKKIEFIVADDASSDATPEIMKRYSRYFAKEIYFEKNNGGQTDLAQYATGKYIALMHSDDLWEKDKLALQVRYMEDHPECGVCLTWSEYTDENLNLIRNNIFKRPNRSREEWVQFFWEKGNALCNPSSLARPEFFYKDLYYGCPARQLPDMFRWVDLVQKTNIYILPRVLTFMRRHTQEGSENTSILNKETFIRMKIESGINWMLVIRDMDRDFFVKAFKKHLINKDPQTEEEVMAEKYFLLLGDQNEFTQHSALYYYFENYAKMIDVLKEKYNYSVMDMWKDQLQKGIGGMMFR